MMPEDEPVGPIEDDPHYLLIEFLYDLHNKENEA